MGHNVFGKFRGEAVAILVASLCACGESATARPPGGVGGGKIPDAGSAGDAAPSPAGDAAADGAAPPPPPDSGGPVGNPFANPPAAKAGRVLVGVRNGCPAPLWIHAAGNPEVLQPDNAKLATGEVRWYDAPVEWKAARITAYGEGPQTGEIDKAEMTFEGKNGGAVLNYNITYVDWLGLPISMEALGDGPDCKSVGCYVKRSDVLTGCPDGLFDGTKCQAARSYCLNPANAGKDYCKKLDGEIARCVSTKPGCAGAQGSGTREVYACAPPFFDGSPKWCAALNRGMLDDPDNTTTSLYYSKGVYNTYAKWVHQVCPGIYAFPYDDYPSNAEQSGFHACAGGRELHLTFCPSG